MTHPYEYDTLFKYLCSVGVISPIKESTNLNKGTQSICASFLALIEKIPGFNVKCNISILACETNFLSGN